LIEIFYFKKYQKLNKGKNGIDFSSNIDNAKKSIAKVMDHRLDKLTTLLDANKTQLNVTNLNEISIVRQNQTNEVSDNNSCSSTIQDNPLLIPLSKRFKVNSSIRKHKCETCNKRFPSQSLLKIHNRIPKLVIACDQVPKSFSTNGSLIIHKRIHSGEKPYACDVCQKSFTLKGNLLSHKILHTGEKPHQCDFCPKKFAHSNNLTDHRRIHTGEKPYECGSCHMKF
jgi:uncharacterized Zn-finger protein